MLDKYLQMFGKLRTDKAHDSRRVDRGTGRGSYKQKEPPWDGGTKEMGTLNRIELDSKVCNGKPVIRGTRIPVSVVLERLAAHESWQAILSAYPGLKEEDIQEAILYACA